jgi:hypothetical protein
METLGKEREGCGIGLVNERKGDGLKTRIERKR